MTLEKTANALVYVYQRKIFEAVLFWVSTSLLVLKITVFGLMI
jgi:hypothetical protein